MDTVNKERDATSTEQQSYAKEAIKVEIVGLVTNGALFVLKLFAGIFGNSAAMVSDAIHTASDVFADLIAIVGLQLSKQKEDDSHQYGHEKIESIFTIILGVVLLVVGFSVGKPAVIGIIDYINGDFTAIAQPGVIAIIAALISIVSKEVLFQYVIKKSKKLNSPTLKATAWHHRSDSFSSIGALIGVVGARFGIMILDPIASIIICVIVVKIGVEVLISAIKNLIDSSADEDQVNRIHEICNSFPGVDSVIEIKTRQFGHRIYVDAIIGCNEEISFKESHSIAEALHDKLEYEISSVKHVLIHVEPIAI